MAGNDDQTVQQDGTPEGKTVSLEQYQALQRKLDTSRKVGLEALRAQAQTATEMAGRQERVETMLDLVLNLVGRGNPEVESTIADSRKELTAHKEQTATYARVTAGVKAEALEHGVDVDSDPRFESYRAALSNRNYAEAATLARQTIVGLDEEPLDVKVEKRVRELLRESGRAVDQGGATAPTPKPQEWTRAKIATLTPAEWKKNKEEILAATAAGRIKG